jgi:hypothetical protein
LLLLTFLHVSLEVPRLISLPHSLLPKARSGFHTLCFRDGTAWSSSKSSRQTCHKCSPTGVPTHPGSSPSSRSSWSVGRPAPEEGDASISMRCLGIRGHTSLGFKAKTNSRRYRRTPTVANRAACTSPTRSGQGSCSCTDSRRNGISGGNSDPSSPTKTELNHWSQSSRGAVSSQDANSSASEGKISVADSWDSRADQKGRCSCLSMPRPGYP